MVPSKVPVKVPVVAVVSAAVMWAVAEPVACANRPVPPVMVSEPVIWNTCGLEVGQATSLALTNSLSPFAAVVVSFSLNANPPVQLTFPSVVDRMPSKPIFPRCSSLPVLVKRALVWEVTLKVPEKLPL